MKENKMRIIVVYAVAGVFLIVGLWLMAQNITTTRYYQTQIAAAQQALAEVDPAKADSLEGEFAALEAENQTLQQTRDTLRQEIAELDETNTELQTEYDAIVDAEDTLYYRAILDSLTEGLKRVEECISGNE